MGDVTLSLTKDEALVLLELLHRWEDGDSVDPALLPGERTALWSLSGVLERELSEPFSQDHRDRVALARGRLMAQGGA